MESHDVSIVKQVINTDLNSHNYRGSLVVEGFKIKERQGKMMAEIKRKYHISDLDREISIEITRIRKKYHLVIHFVFVPRRN